LIAGIEDAAFPQKHSSDPASDVRDTLRG